MRNMRRIKFNDPQTGKWLVFLTNNFALDALTIAKLYKYRWQVELFFKWIKQHLRIKAFFGTSENAVKSQIWIAVFGLRPGRHREKAPRAAGNPLRNSTDFESPPCSRKPRSIACLTTMHRRKFLPQTPTN